MPDWNPTELEQIASAREIEVCSLREDGALTKPVTIWAVRVEAELFTHAGATGILIGLVLLMPPCRRGDWIGRGRDPETPD